MARSNGSKRASLKRKYSGSFSFHSAIARLPLHSLGVRTAVIVSWMKLTACFAIFWSWCPAACDKEPARFSYYRISVWFQTKAPFPNWGCTDLWRAQTWIYSGANVAVKFHLRFVFIAIPVDRELNAEFYWTEYFMRKSKNTSRVEPGFLVGAARPIPGYLNLNEARGCCAESFFLFWGWQTLGFKLLWKAKWNGELFHQKISMFIF